ncbi:protein deadpan-like [Palaemon carinicauda]|uniref:protein deadpan-like n=1 Tax=Palaemon carinicauda TaxID=392227 RepID=UPI0035B5EC2F
MSNKPLMEKKRRQRINRCLNDLKTLVLEALKKDPSRYSKLEKADILEMTVRHVQALHRHESTNGRMTAFSGGRMTAINGRQMGVDERAKYRAGFNQCAVEVTRYLSGMTGVPKDLHTKIVTHLNSISSTFTGFQTLPLQPAMSGHLLNGTGVVPIIPPVSSSEPTPSSSIIATAADSSTTGSTDSLANNSVSQTQPQVDNNSISSFKRLENAEPSTPVTVSAGVTLVPARLANGQMALILPPGTNVPFKSQRKNICTLSESADSAGAITEANGGKQSENSDNNKKAFNSNIQVDNHTQKYNAGNVTSQTVYGIHDAQRVIVGLSVQGPSEYFKTNHETVFSRHPSLSYSNFTYCEPKITDDPKRHLEISLPTSSSLNCENGTFPTVSMSSPQASSLLNLSGNASLVSNERPLWMKHHEKEGMSSSQCSHVAISVTRQQDSGASGSRPDLHSSSQTVLIKPKPQLPTGALFLHGSPMRCEQSLKYPFASPSNASPTPAFESHLAAAQEPLNLVVTCDEQSREDSATCLSYSPSSSSLLSCSLPMFSSSSSSPSLPSPSSSSASSHSVPASLSLSSPPLSNSAAITNPSSSSTTPSTSSSSSSLKAPSSLQIRKRITPYEVPVAVNNGEGQHWRPW